MSPSPSKMAQRIALVSVSSNTTLTLLKFLVAWTTGSVSILSEGIHSSMDLLASIIAFLAVRMSRRPADREHPWGHGKAENLSAVAEGLLIFFAAGLIVVEAAKKILEPQPVDQPLLGVALMAFSAAVNTVVAILLYRTAKKTGSLALEADALHLKTDVLTSVGVAVGLGLMALTGWPILDPLVAILVAGLIIKESWHLVSKSFSPLMDGALTDSERKALEVTLDGFRGPGVDYHGLKARRSGHQIFVEFHLTMPGETPLSEAHALTERIEEALASDEITASIHMEPQGNQEP